MVERCIGALRVSRGGDERLRQVEGFVRGGGGAADCELLDACDGTAGGGGGGIGVVEDERGAVRRDGGDVGSVGGEEVGEVDACKEEAG